MIFIQALLNSIPRDAPIRKLIVGAHWSTVASLGCGMASTVMSIKPHGEEVVRDAGLLHNKSVKELAQYLLSENWLEASIGLAALNSLLTPPIEKLARVNAFKVVAEKGHGKHVAIFGHFPYLDALRTNARRVSVFELNPNAEELGLDQVPHVLPDADVVAITSNTLINHTLENILPHLKSGVFSVLVGPSTPLSPLCFEAGFDLLAGVRIVDEEALFLSVGQGATFRQVRGAQLVTYAKE